MRTTTKLAIALGISMGYILVDSAINSAYESVLKFLRGHPRLPLRKNVESAVIGRYLARNMRGTPEYHLPESPIVEMVYNEGSLDDAKQKNEPLDWERLL